MGINKVEMNWTEDELRKIWRCDSGVASHSHIEMKYNVLILNASDRINHNDLRFSPWGVQHKNPTPRDRAVIALVGVVKAREHTAVAHWFRSVIYVQPSLFGASGENGTVSVSIVCWLWTKM